jgi:hypothetical protein
MTNASKGHCATVTPSDKISGPLGDRTTLLKVSTCGLLHNQKLSSKPLLEPGSDSMGRRQFGPRSEKRIFYVTCGFVLATHTVI